MKKPRFVYLLTALAEHSVSSGLRAYASIEALVLDPENTFDGSSSAIRTARRAAGDSYPVLVKGHRVDKLEIQEMASIRALLSTSPGAESEELNRTAARLQEGKKSRK